MIAAEKFVLREVPLHPSYYRARYYNPTTGRFLSEDPIGFRAGVNLYSYVLGDPIMFGDPLGLCPAGMHEATPDELSKVLAAAN